MQRADEPAVGGKVDVLLGRHVQRIGHRRIVVRPIGHASRLAGVKSQRFSFGRSQIQRHQGIELMRVLDRRDRSSPEDSVRLAHAGAVVGPDAVQVELHHPRRRQFAAHDRRLNRFDRRFLDLECCRLRRRQRWREEDESCR